MTVAGCGHNEKKYTVVKDFPIEETLEPVRVVHYDPVESNILTLDRAGDWWISQNIKNYSGESDSKCFSLLDDDFRTVVRFGTWGRGPQEFVEASYQDYEGMKGDSIIITVRDWTLGRLIRLTAHTGNGGYRTELLQDFHKSMRAIHSLGEGRRRGPLAVQRGQQPLLFHRSGRAAENLSRRLGRGSKRGRRSRNHIHAPAVHR